MADNPRIEELKRRVQSDPASIAFAALAEEYRRAGQFEEAISTCQAGLQRHPAYLSAHVTLGRALIEVDRFDEAREELEYVLKIAPENLAAIRALAEIDHRRGDGAEEQHYKAALDTAVRRDAHIPEPARPAPASPTSQAPAAQPVRVTPSEAPAAAPNPSLAELEAFLDAIVRARQELESAESDRR
jgi:tetratricopeptide (TPR) repeat protein